MAEYLLKIGGLLSMLLLFAALAADAYLFFKEVTKVKRPGVYAAACFAAAAVLWVMV